MAVAYTVFDHGTFVYAQMEGIVTEAELIGHERALVEDPGVRARFRQLLDVRRVSGPCLDRAQLLEGLDRVRKCAGKISGSRCAVIAHDAWWFNVQFQRQCEKYGSTMIAFNDPATACLWLGVDYVQVLQAAAPDSGHTLVDAGQELIAEVWSGAG
jgi:hypothetical protein